MVGRRLRPWRLVSLLAAPICLVVARMANGGETCNDTPLNWTAIREDLTSYVTLSEPRYRSRRCFGLDPGMWSYCGTAALRLLQLQPGLIDAGPREQGWWTTPPYARSPCRIGNVAVELFAMGFLTPEERYGMLFQVGAHLDALKLSFKDLLSSKWPVFGLLARLAEEVAISGASRSHVPCTLATNLSAESQLAKLQIQLLERVEQRRLVPSELPLQLLAELEAVGIGPHVPLSGNAALPTSCALALAAAWAARADTAVASNSGAIFAAAAEAGPYVDRAEAALRAMDSNYTFLDWLSMSWPTFSLLHRMQFDIVIGNDPAPDVVPRDASSGRPLRFAFNRDFGRPDHLHIDIASDIVRTDILRTLPRFFGMHNAFPSETWNVNFVYTSNDYNALIPAQRLRRLRRSQRLVYVPRGNDVLGEKDMQCRLHKAALARWNVLPSFDNEVGGMPACFELPGERRDLRSFGKTSKSGSRSRLAFVRKPEGAWGGRGVEIRYGVEDLVSGEAWGGENHEECAFATLEDAQCLGLRESRIEGAAASADSCRAACCEEDDGPGGEPCDAWNWRQDEGCWVGSPRLCTESNPVYLGGWRGGRRLRGHAAAPRAVVQQYILDPVLYQLDFNGPRDKRPPPLRVKTDIRVYGAAVSLDPLRLYLSKHGYFRTGYLERNYSTSSDDDLQDRLMHITHHIPKIEAGSFQCPTAPSWGDPEDAERGAGGGSGGSLQKWFEIARDQNGLDPEEVWSNVQTVVALFVLEARQELSCHASRAAGEPSHRCGSVGFHFFADLVVDSSGRAWLMEIHPTLALKSHGLGDPEGGWVEVLTRETRQGSMGTLAMFFAGWMNQPYRRWLETQVKRYLLFMRPLWRVEERLLLRLAQRSAERGNGYGEDTSLAGILSRMLLEDHMACRFGVTAVLPRAWRRVDLHVRAGEGPRGDPFGDGLRPLYRLYEAVHRAVKRASPPEGLDLRPARCAPLDFNADTVWDQPWERTSRRFKV
eukprot:TRINITY_DN1308_c0_g1_i2.p1 TRINITY_DN1308_c0_g1~~TRINITY_DN1308_c0_g1_i2.p1  ORF type:complete len:993 (+),score=76.32 TRINITY_DN1308_c0_g1_i2:1423-4401(+)